MKQTLASVMVAVLFTTAFACSNWNRYTPKGVDNGAIEEEIRKNLAADGFTGMHVDVSNGVVTIKGDVKTAADRQKAVDDAAKVNGVKRVVNEIAVKP